MICFCNKSLNKIVYLPQFLIYNQSKYHNLFKQTNPNILISLCKPIQINILEACWFHLWGPRKQELEGSREIELSSNLLVEGSCDFELPSAPCKLRQIVSNLNLLSIAYVMISMQISCFNEFDLEYNLTHACLFLVLYW
jgi:hypothetical protein